MAAVFDAEPLAAWPARGQTLTVRGWGQPRGTAVATLGRCKVLAAGPAPPADPPRRTPAAFLLADYANPRYQADVARTGLRVVVERAVVESRGADGSLVLTGRSNKVVVGRLKATAAPEHAAAFAGWKVGDEVTVEGVCDGRDPTGAFVLLADAAPAPAEAPPPRPKAP